MPIKMQNYDVRLSYRLARQMAFLKFCPVRTKPIRVRENTQCRDCSYIVLRLISHIHTRQSQLQQNSPRQGQVVYIKKQSLLYIIETVTITDQKTQAFYIRYFSLSRYLNIVLEYILNKIINTFCMSGYLARLHSMCKRTIFDNMIMSKKNFKKSLIILNIITIFVKI